MRCLITPVLLLTLAGSLLATEPKLEPLFNGKDLTGWRVEGAEGFWRVEEGVLIGEHIAGASGHCLWTEKSYGDFVLEFEVRWTGEVDTGIDMREPHIRMQPRSRREVLNLRRLTQFWSFPWVS